MRCIERWALKGMGDGQALIVLLSCTIKCIWTHLPFGFLFPKAASGKWTVAGHLGCCLAPMHWNSSGTCYRPASSSDLGTCFNCFVPVLWHWKSISDRLVYRGCIWQTDILLLAPPFLIYLLINNWLRNLPGTAFPSHHTLSWVHGFKIKLINLTFKVSPLWPRSTCSSCLITHSSHREILKNNEAIFHSLFAVSDSVGHVTNLFFLYELHENNREG